MKNYLGNLTNLFSIYFLFIFFFILFILIYYINLLYIKFKLRNLFREFIPRIFPAEYLISVYFKNFLEFRLFIFFFIFFLELFL